jgi:hypothetical protein
METSIFIARIASIIYLAAGVGFLFYGDYYKKVVKNFIDNPGASYIAALFTIVLGYFIVSYHNIWEMSWVVIITILGWGALIKGVLVLAFPEPIMKLSESMIKMKKLQYFAPIAIILGLVLGYFGFIA